MARKSSKVAQIFIDSFNRKKLALSCLTAFLIATAAYMTATSTVGASANFFMANRSEYFLREYMRRDPDIHPQLKIFAFDDKTVASYKRSGLTMEDWSVVINSLAAAKPRSIIIDQIFSALPSENMSGLAAFRQSLADAGMVGAAAFVHDYLITGRQPLSFDTKDYRLERYTSRPLDEINWMQIRAPHVYGPHPEIRDSFRHIGHVLYPGFGKVDPLVRIGKNAAVPHLTLFAAEKIDISGTSIHINDSMVSLDRDGRIPLNFSSTEKYLRATMSMKGLLGKAEKSQVQDLVNEGDVVLIIPAFATGNLDILEGATGRVPGGFMLAAMLNSMLRNDWLTPVDRNGFLIVAAAVVGLALGYTATAFTFWPLLIALSTLALGGAFGAFVFAGFQVSWLFPFGCFFLTSTSCYGITMVERMLETQKLRDALKGSVPEAKLREIISNSCKLQLEASERVVTLMFLDIANFSVVSEQQSARDTFLYLKEVLRDITRIIHKYGGTVDRTLGDGILCFFGYTYDGEISENQADQAIRCAIEIQRHNIEKCIKAVETGATALPYRIGLNTSSVYIGDIGNEDRIDFTVIGNGVNYAQRLEAACEHHSLMISGTTMDFSTVFNARMPGFKKRFINIKHHEELIEAIEFNPLHDNAERLSQVHQAFRKSNNLERKEQRWPVTDAGKVRVETEFGTATMVDFSSSGFCIQISSYLSKGIIFDLSLVFSQEDLNKLAGDFGINSIKAEVRWGKVAGDEFCHGVRITNLNAGQLENLFQFLRSTFNRNITAEQGLPQDGSAA
jgi:class 3 adenylate cyclase